MKDYRLKKSSEPDYILDAVPRIVTSETEEGKKARVETMDIKFADGRVFHDVQYNSENLKTIAEQQERQAKAGVANMGVFERRRTMSGVMTGASIVGGPVIGAALAVTTAIPPVAIAIGAGALTLGTLIPAAYSLVKNCGKVTELRKIEYRNSNKKDLVTYPQYENSLVGLSSSKREWFLDMASQTENPFCITEMDAYTQKDLEKIMKNINTEKTYQFTYAKKAQK